MAIETEKKFRVDARQMAKIVARLKKKGAAFSRIDFEENFLHRGGVLDDRRATLRLRKVGDKTLLTYKESIRDDLEVKHKIEFETEVSDVEAMEKIIGMLGYRLSVVYEKKRSVWHLDSVEIVLDELPFGLFMEIEGTHKNIVRAEKLLGLQKLKPEIRGYPSLTLKHGRPRGGVMEARFSKNKRSKK